MNITTVLLWQLPSHLLCNHFPLPKLPIFSLSSLFLSFRGPDDLTVRPSFSPIPQTWACLLLLGFFMKKLRICSRVNLFREKYELVAASPELRSVKLGRTGWHCQTQSPKAQRGRQEWAGWGCCKQGQGPVRPDVSRAPGPPHQDLDFILNKIFKLINGN